MSNSNEIVFATMQLVDSVNRLIGALRKDGTTKESTKHIILAVIKEQLKAVTNGNVPTNLTESTNGDTTTVS